MIMGKDKKRIFKIKNSKAEFLITLLYLIKIRYKFFRQKFRNKIKK